jgi:hypothetical protein
MDNEPTVPFTSPTQPLTPPPLTQAPSTQYSDAGTDVKSSETPSPRIRWAGIVWGTVFAVLAGIAVWTLAEASRITAVHEWLRTLSPTEVHPGWVIGIVALTGGVLLVILGGVALLRSAQVRMTVER